ncbi:MAG: asparagine--tRNA ligase [Planctomycetes bacterium]|nr:asparagine--tRNA ligase [Planctomycetota bacterium]
MEPAPRVPVSALPAHAGSRVEIAGWLYNRRSSGKIHFLQVRDGTGVVQAVVGKGDVPPDLFERCETLAQETSLIVRGVVRADARAPLGVEIGADSVEVVQIAEPYPLGKKEHGPDFLLTQRHLWLRSRKPWAVLRVRDSVIRAIRDFFHKEGFLCVDAPVFTPAACEGTTTLFGVDYFDLGKAYLTQSGQLYSEAAAMAHGKVYCFGPVFRAERSKTRRHLTEFWMVEPEAAFYTLNDVMSLAERFLEAVVARTLEERREELKILERDPVPLERVRAPFPRISYDEAVEKIRSAGGAIEWGEDFGSPQETALSASYDRPVMVHRYPAQVKAFYMKRDPSDARVALCVDVLAPEGVGEIIGGSQREDDLEALLGRVREHKLPQEAFEWYLDLRRYGSVPHGGFGLGLERTVGWICGLEHVREAIPFPRMMYRIVP